MKSERKLALLDLLLCLLYRLLLFNLGGKLQSPTPLMGEEAEKKQRGYLWLLTLNSIISSNTHMAVECFLH